MSDRREQSERLAQDKRDEGAERAWAESQGRRFKVSTVNAVEALVARMGYDRAVERTLDDIRTFVGATEPTRQSLVVYARERLDCLRAYEKTLRATEAILRADSGPADDLGKSGWDGESLERALPGEAEAIADARDALEQGAGLSVPQTEALLAVAEQPSKQERVNNAFARAVAAANRRTEALREQQVRAISTHLLVAEVERRGYSAVKISEPHGPTMADLLSTEYVVHSTPATEAEPISNQRIGGEQASAEQVREAVAKVTRTTTSAHDAEREQGADAVLAQDDESERRASAEAWFRSTVERPEPQPIPEPTIEQRVARLEQALEQTSAALRSLEGRSWR